MAESSLGGTGGTLGFFRLLTLAERELARRLEVALAQCGSTLDQWQILNFVADTAGSPMTAIADHVGMPAPTLTKIIDKLVSSNLVLRRADANDRRKVLILASARGAAALADWNSLTEPTIREFSDSVGDRDAAKLMRMLEQLVVAPVPSDSGEALLR